MDNVKKASSEPESVTIDKSLLLALLEAAKSTSKNHQGQGTELYSLGALEATANFVYIIAAQQEGNGNLEVRCQEYAKFAIKRMESLFKDSLAS